LRSAIRMRDAVKEKIRDQDPSWERLKETTIFRKKSSKILIEHADLINSITHAILGPYTAMVGVLRTARRRDNNQPLVNIARVQEFGFAGIVTNSTTGASYYLRIPARPYLIPTLEAMKNTIFEIWLRELVLAVRASV